MTDDSPAINWQLRPSNLTKFWGTSEKNRYTRATMKKIPRPANHSTPEDICKIAIAAGSNGGDDAPVLTHYPTN